MYSKVDIVIGNQTVIKDLPVHASRSEFSDDAKTNQVAYIKLKSPLVLKKDVEFKVVLKNCGKLPAPILNTFIGIGLQGYGKILKSRGTL